MPETVNIRQVVLDILIEINEKNSFSHITINNALKKFQYLEKNERSFISRVSQGTVEKLIYLDYVIDSFSKVPVRKMKPLIRNLMRMSVYQLLFMDNIPESAVCNEAVKIANKRGFVNLKGFVNGVLRNIARSKDDIKVPNDLSIQYSMPQWIIDMWRKTYDEETIITMLKSFDNSSKTYVRCNTTLASVEEIVSMLTEQGVKATKIKGIDGALEISEYDYLGNVSAFTEGFVSVQDLSSMLSCVVAKASKKDRVIDVCAAPGGKSIFIAEVMDNTGLVDARDISLAKTQMMEETFRRLKLNNAIASVKDGTVLYEEDIETADLVIADLPCSGLGIIGRKPDIKYRVTQKSLQELVELQRNILKCAAKYVKKGGRLIYSTCTINTAENEENVKWIKDNLGLSPVSLLEKFPQEFVSGVKDTLELGYIQLLPGMGKTDGFFISEFVKE